MKLFTLRATTEEQKANQALQLRLLQVFVIIFMTAVGVTLAFNAVFGKLPDEKIQNVMSVPCIIVLIGLVPSVMKYPWKVLVPQTVMRTVIITIFVLGLERIW